MDVPFLMVRLLHGFLARPHEFTNRYIPLVNLRHVIEAKVGHRITLEHTDQTLESAQEFERRLRRIVAVNPGFATQLWRVVNREYPKLVGNWPVYDPGLLQRDEAFAPSTWGIGTFVALGAIVIALVALAVVAALAV